MSTRSPEESAVPSPPTAEEPVSAGGEGTTAGEAASDGGAQAVSADADGGAQAAFADDDGVPATVPDAPVHRVVDVADPSRVRRAPRYGRFALIGLVLAVLVSFGLTFVPGAEDGLTRRNLFFLLLLTLGTAGIVLGLLVALWTDRRSLRRRR